MVKGSFLTTLQIFLLLLTVTLAWPQQHLSQTPENKFQSDSVTIHIES
jgi:hypothetical protein